MISATQLEEARIALLSCERISSGRMYAVPTHLAWSVGRLLAQAAQETRVRAGKAAVDAELEAQIRLDTLRILGKAYMGAEEEEIRADKIFTAEENDRDDEPTRDEPEPAHITPAVAARREIDDFAEELAAQLDEAGLEQLAFLVRRVRPR